MSYMFKKKKKLYQGGWKVTMSNETKAMPGSQDIVQ